MRILLKSLSSTRIPDFQNFAPWPTSWRSATCALRARAVSAGVTSAHAASSGELQVLRAPTTTPRDKAGRPRTASWINPRLHRIPVGLFKLRLCACASGLLKTGSRTDEDHLAVPF